MIDLRARNFVHIKPFLRARCVHDRHHRSNFLRAEVSLSEKTKQNRHPRRITNSLEKAGLLHPAHIKYRRWKSPTRTSSNTKQISTNKDKEIEDLRPQTK